MDQPCRSSIGRYYETQYELENTITKEQLDGLLKDVNGEGVYEGKVELRAKGKKKSGEIMVLEENSTLIGFVDPKRNWIELPEDKLSISYKMAENLGVKVGDEISWHIYGDEKWNCSIIGEVYRTPFTQGITMYRSLYENYGYNYLPSMVVSEQENQVGQYQEGEQGITKISDKAELVESYKIIAKAMDIMVYTLLIAAIILAVVVIYNLGVLSFAERQRELSTL